MNKFTPGPWSVDAGYIVGLVDPANAETIATFEARPSNADANLIAAAPDLYAALLELSDWMRERTGPADGTVGMLTWALSALAKVQP